MSEAIDAGTVPVPIACTLAARAMELRLHDWQRLLSSASAATSGGVGIVYLHFPKHFPVAELAALCAEEVQCCPFFTFTLELRTDAVTLTVVVPAEAHATLEGLVALLPAGVGP